MIEAIVKLLLSDKSRVTLQFGILISVIVAAFYAGSYAKTFTIAQQKTYDEQKKIAESLQKLIDQSRNYWTYQMQRDYDSQLILTPDGRLAKPNLSEIREKHTN